MMKAMKFTGANSREALRAVKRELGDDAVILSNRKVAEGVEITALKADALSALQPAGRSPAAASRGSAAEADGALAREIGALRELLQVQLGGLVWADLLRREPAQARLLRDLLHAGFSPLLARTLTAQLPAGLEPGAARRLVRDALAANLACAPEDEIVERGGVYALMGPTGVGKTTTTAKLAARCVVRYGAERVALLTTDTYRIGAHEQLRLYARILGLSVHAICDETDLRAVLGDLSGRHIVLIDTVGMSQRDRRVSEHVGMLCGAGSVNRVLLLSACGSADSLDETVRAYRGTESLAGVVLTKIDEAVSLGGAVDVVVRHRLKLHYLTNGQRVPEDLHAPNREYLLHRALSQRPAEAAYAVQDSDVPGLLGMARVAPAAAATMVRT
jgi:flagellar biosynthesis protein FlhF